MTTNDSAGFVLSEAQDAAIAEAGALVVHSQRVVALTGAGLSVESGIPPFRGKGGLWTKYGEPPMDGYQRFVTDPAQAWAERLQPTAEWAKGLRDTLSRAKPNVGHHVFAELERRGRCSALVTQNIDDLHGQAGTRNLLEIHGNHRLLRCLDCVTRFEPEELEVDPENLPPFCPHCGGLVKGDTVQFGEPIPADVLRRCYEEVERADCMLVAGTSATVYPAADLPMEILRRGGAVIEVNPEPTELSPVASLTLRGPAGAVLERLLHHVSRALEDGAS
jgi:NAD-dependent deacetylase